MKNQVEIQFKGADIEASQALRAQRIAENQEIQEKNQKAMAIKESNAKIHAYVMSLEKQMEKIDDLHKLTDCDYNSKVRELEKQIEILTTGNFPTPDCKTCPFVSSAFQAQEELKTLIKPVHEMSEINSLKAEIVSAEEQLEDDQKILFLVQVPEDRTKELESVLVAGEKIAGYQRDIARITKELEEMQKEYSSMTPVNDSDILYKIAIIGKEKEILARDIASIGDETNALRQEIANMRAIMKQNEEIRARIEILKKENENNVRLAKIYDYLQRAFGRNGIQALLIDTAIPSLQAVSDELIQIATDGRMRIAFSTQKDLKDGRTAESLEIIATDDRGSRDVSTFSGGEQKILRTVIRLTLAIFQSQQAKRKLETMMIDEAFDALDADNAGNLLNVLSKVSDYFKKVVFISHSDEFLAEFPNKIMLKKRDACTEITKS